VAILRPLVGVVTAKDKRDCKNSSSLPIGGFRDIDENETALFDDDGGPSSTFNVLLSADGLVEVGGRWRPNWCLPRQRIAIIVPFRKRETQLRVFLRHVRSILRRQLLDFTIFVVEQV